MGRVGVHLGAVGILIAQHFSGKFNHHHLHAQANAKGGDVVGAGISNRFNLSFNAAGAKARANDNAVQAGEGIGHIGGRYILAVHKFDIHPLPGVDAGNVQAFANAFVGILEVVFSHQANLYALLEVLFFLDKCFPLGEGLLVALQIGHGELGEDGAVQALPMHIQRHLIDAGEVFALDYAVGSHVTESGYLLQDFPAQVLLGAED